jgi:Na+-driven multidrug efflux pump
MRPDYKLKHFAMCPLDALGTALCTFTSQNLGAGRVDRIRSGLKIGLLLALVYGGGSGAVLVLFGQWRSHTFLSRAERARYLPRRRSLSGGAACF